MATRVSHVEDLISTWDPSLDPHLVLVRATGWSAFAAIKQCIDRPDMTVHVITDRPRPAEIDPRRVIWTDGRDLATALAAETDEIPQRAERHQIRSRHMIVVDDYQQLLDAASIHDTAEILGAVDALVARGPGARTHLVLLSAWMPVLTCWELTRTGISIFGTLPDGTDVYSLGRPAAAPHAIPA